MFRQNKRVSKMRILLCIGCIFLIGCASTANIGRDDLGRVTDIKITGQLKGSVKTNAEEITFDSKNEPILSNLVNVNALKES